MTDLVLLTALLGGPAYGYALKRTAGLIFGTGVLHNNVVYPLLKKFVQCGWVQQSTVPGERGQERKQYRITAAGRNYLLEQIAAFGDSEACDDGAFLFRVAMFDLLPEEKRSGILAARKVYLTVRLRELSELKKMRKAQLYGAVVLDRYRSLVRNEWKWIAKLEQLGKRRSYAHG